MPRSTSDGSGGTLFRSVFAKSPLSLLSKSEGNKPDDSEPTSPKLRRHRSPSFLSHKRSSSQQSALVLDTNTSDPSTITKRQRSFSHADRIRPLSLSRLALHSSADTPVSPSDQSLESTDESPYRANEEFYGRVLHHGDVQTSQSGWRKKHEYVVLTEHYLLRFKSVKKAADKFPWIFPISAQLRHTRGSASISSIHELTSLSGSDSPTDLSGTKSIIPLKQVIAVQTSQESKSKVTLEVAWQPPHGMFANTISLSVEQGPSRNHWLESLSEIAKQSQKGFDSSRSTSPNRLFRPGTSVSSSTALNEEDFRYPVYLRQSHGNELGSISPEDLAKEPTAAYLLIINQYRVELVSASKVQKSSSTSLASAASKSTSFGIVSLCRVNISERDDAFDLVFRTPQQPPVSLELASIHSKDIIQRLHSQLEYLRPNWSIDQNLFRIPSSLSSKLGASETILCPSQQSFDRVLEAYCAAWGLSSSAIHIEIQSTGEDAPRFQLLSRTTGHRRDYAILEILAVMRALRYNDYFATISFANIPLDRLALAFDHFGHDHICMRPRMGQYISIELGQMQEASLLFQELSAVVMTNRKLRRLDFSNSICHVPRQNFEDNNDDRGSGLVESLYRLCSNQNTNVDWIVLNGISLSRTDLDYVIALLANRDCHLRAVELGGCHLDLWSLRLLMSELPTQSNTLEVINLSNNPGRLSPNIAFSSAFSDCQSLRVLNLSRISLDEDAVSLIPSEILLSWRLEELRLSYTPLNESTIDTLIKYLEAPQSRALQRLYLNHCGINSRDISRIFDALSKNQCVAQQEFHLDISRNNIRCLDDIIPALEGNHRITSLKWRGLEIDDPQFFAKFIQSLTDNFRIHHLDLAELLLDFHLSEASLEPLHKFLSDNRIVSHFNLSGNNSRLDNCSFGPQLHSTLEGLAQNTTLKIFSIQDQALSLKGAAVLAEVIKKNTTLLELHCDNNSIPIAGFALIVDAMETNTSLQFVSSLPHDRKTHSQAVESSVMKAARPKKMLHHISMSPKEKRFLPTDINTALTEINQAVAAHWTYQQTRLQKYLERNRRLAAGQEVVLDSSDADSEATAGADGEDVAEFGMPSLEMALSKFGFELDGEKYQLGESLLD